MLSSLQIIIVKFGIIPANILKNTSQSLSLLFHKFLGCTNEAFAFDENLKVRTLSAQHIKIKIEILLLFLFYVLICKKPKGIVFQES
jgi:hypothetical protein